MGMDKQLKFIHITKTAGTSIEDVAIENGIEWGRFHHEYGWWHEVFPIKPNYLKEKYDWFMVVRNPYTRILSEFHCQWGGVGNDANKFTKQLFNDYLIHRINDCHTPFYWGNGPKVGKHYTPQHEYLDNSYDINVLKMERLSSDFDSLMKLYGLNIKLDKKVNTTNKIFGLDDMSNKLKDLIKKTYEKDFELFNYDI